MSTELSGTSMTTLNLGKGLASVTLLACRRELLVIKSACACHSSRVLRAWVNPASVQGAMQMSNRPV